MSFPTYLIDQMIEPYAIYCSESLIYIPIINVISEIQVKSRPTVKLFVNDIECQHAEFFPSTGKVVMGSTMQVIAKKPNMLLRENQLYKFKIVLDMINVITLDFERRMSVK